MVQLWRDEVEDAGTRRHRRRGRGPGRLPPRLRRPRRPRPGGVAGPRGHEPLRRMALFDVVVNNADRKGGHVLPMPDGHRHGVDHGLTFHVEHKLRTVLWGFVGDPITAEEADGLRRLAAALDGELGATLAGLLTDDEVETTAASGRPAAGAGHVPRPALVVVPRHPLAAVLRPAARRGTRRRRGRGQIEWARALRNEGATSGRIEISLPSGGRRHRSADRLRDMRPGRRPTFPTARDGPRGAGARHRERRPRRDPARGPGADVRLRDHPLRRHPHGARRDLRRLRPAQPRLAQRRPRGDVRPERDRRRRPAARARHQGQRRLGRAGPARDPAVP